MSSLNQSATAKRDFWLIIYQWQTCRFLWLFGGFFALALELFSVLFFQKYLHLAPCAYCVQIRLAMITVFLGALLAAISPSFRPGRLLGYIICLGAIFKGLELSTRLEIITLETAYNPTWLSPCGPGRAKFPFGLPLDRLWPVHFEPTGICGEAFQWTLFGFNMPEWLMMIYIMMGLGLVLMLSSWLTYSLRRRF